MPIDTFVIVPTYNEADNLDELLQQLLALPSAIGAIVVDDNSPDGTGAIADALDLDVDLIVQQPGRNLPIYRIAKHSGLRSEDL